LESANEIVDLAIAYHGTIVRAIDLAGDETRYPPELFVEPFHRAREAGVHITVHAGEAAGPESVREAVCSLGAERIGHGIRALEDSNVVQMVYEGRVTLEVCPTSNLQTGVVPWLAIHPLPDLLRLRLQITINTDNVSISNTTLTDEYVVAVADLGLTERQIYTILSNALNAAFLPAAERSHLRTKFREWLKSYPNAAEILDS
jgi:adenosine deaminase